MRMDYKCLIDQIRKEEVTVFIGSGFSLKAGAPSGRQLADIIINKMPPHEMSCQMGLPLDIVAENYEQKYGRKALLDIVSNSMEFVRKDMFDHYALSQIPHFHHIFTTNYDTLIEDTYGENNMFVVRRTEDCTKIPNDKTILYKIHGDFDATDNIILTKQDYINFFSSQKEPLMWGLLESEILTKDILFIGYSLEDSNIFEIMKRIKASVNGNTRRFFLIAPGLPDYKIKRLAKTNVTYYDSKAEDFFPQLFHSLDKHISSDYKKGRCSFRTFSKYCSLKKIKVYGTENNEGNSVIYETIGKGNINVNLKLDEKIGVRLFSQDSSLFQTNLPGTKIPSAKITRENLKGFEVTMNGMTIKTIDEVTSLYIGPGHKEIEVSYIIPSIGFKEKTIATIYKLGDTITFFSNMPSYTIKFEMNGINKQSSKCSCSIVATDKFSNISDAIKWMDLLIAMWEGKELTISGGIKYKMDIPDKSELDYFKKIKKFYENIKQIELYYNVDFKEYENFSNKLYEESEILLHSYDESEIPLSMNEKIHSIEIEGSLNSTKANLPRNTDNCNLALSQTKGMIINFNNTEFQLKCRHTIIPSCKILSLKQIGSNKCLMQIEILNDFIFFKYSDKPLNSISKFQNMERLV